MAFYIELKKVKNIEPAFENYSYEFNLPMEPCLNDAGKMRAPLKLVSGKLKLFKLTGEIKILELAEGDNGMYAERACWALLKHWKKGEYPEKTCWAS